ncbi:phytoene desaturase family protein [Anatilimnocola sp. NA78]|uniref:phytoene desaturase family protein n=1 Tax=Anatilimnocola sp. NA78 TaxID=3415683 RepID=UPI003CE5708E
MSATNLATKSELGSEQNDVVVVGGGLAGLLAATKLAKGGRRVVLLEQAKGLGGRAATTVKGELRFNLGPRALYLHGHAHRLLKELDVPFTGDFPNTGKGMGVYGGKEHQLPRNVSQIFTTTLLSWREKWQLFRFFQQIPTLETASLQHTSLTEWVTTHYGSGAIANLLFGLFRLSTYAADLDALSAGATLDQFRIGLSGNVWYIDGGWQAIVDQLRDIAQQAGVQIRTGAHVHAVRNFESGVLVQATHQPDLRASAAILAVSPQVASLLLGLPEQHALVRWAVEARPVQAACLDLALSQLPRPEHRFELGLDEPTYASVHSAAAQFAPPGVAVIHVMKYLPSETNESARDHEQQLERVLDRWQPGWHSHVLARRYLPAMTVTHALPQAAHGGVAGRPQVAVANYPNVYLAGDWVGQRGQLADASAASAETAVNLILNGSTATNDVRELEYA